MYTVPAMGQGHLTQHMDLHIIYKSLLMKLTNAIISMCVYVCVILFNILC